MAQVKKEAVREAILAAAYTLFRKKGYVATTLQDIATAAKTSRANIYVYFPSKFDVLYAVFHPWLLERLDTLADAITAIADPRQRLRRILTALWRDIPGEANGFANNLMQAISTAPPEQRYSPELLHEAERRVAAMIAPCLLPQSNHAPSNRAPADRNAELRALVHVLFMTFDGFSMQTHLLSGDTCNDAVIDAMTRLLLPETGPGRG